MTMESRIPALSEFIEKSEMKLLSRKFRSLPQHLTWASTLGCGCSPCCFYSMRGSGGGFLVMTPFTGYFLTNLLGPVVKMRYHYPFIACMPWMLYLIWCVYKEKKGED